MQNVDTRSASGMSVEAIGGWIIRVGVALIFVLFGIDKFDSSPRNEWVEIFARIGWGQWFRVATGIVEVGGAALLVFPMTKRVGAAVLAATMLGAIIAHCTVLGDPLRSIVPAVFGVGAVMVGLQEPSYDIEGMWARGAARNGPPRC